MDFLKKYGLLIFWVFLSLDCLLCLTDNKEIAEYRFFTKPLVLPLLAIYFYINTKRSKHPRTKFLVYAGLFFSWIGDLLLMQYDLTNDRNNSKLLMISLIFVSLGLLLYTRIFRKMNKLNIKDCQEAFLSFVAMTILNAVLYKTLKLVNVNNVRFLIVGEVVILSYFVAMAANVYRNKLRKNIAYKKLIPGAAVIALSMYVILAHKFLLDDATFLPSVVVLTYGFGQLLTIEGLKDYLKA